MTVLFKDDFEDQSFWDGQENNPNSVVMQSLVVHHGNFAISASLTAALGASKWADVYKYIGLYEFLYYRALVKVTALPAAGNRVHPMWMGTQGLTTNTAGICIFHDGVAPKWQVYGNTFDYLAVSGVQPQINTWYPLELYYKRGLGGLGAVSGWVNDVSVGSATGKTYADYPAYVQLGVINTEGGTTVTVYGDCAVASTERIYAEVTDVPIIYPTVQVEESLQLPSVSSAVMYGYGARVRTVRHCTEISPWIAK